MVKRNHGRPGRRGLSRWGVGAFIGLATVVGCGGTEELTVYLDSDLTPAQIDQARIDVSRDGDSQYSRDIDPQLDSLASGYTLRLENGGDDGSEVDLVLQGLDEGNPVIERRVEVRFSSDHKLVPLHLCQSCLGIDCEAGQSCVRGSCVDADLDAGALADADDEDAYALTCTGSGGAGGGGGGPTTCDSRCETSAACGECPFRAISGSMSLNFTIARYEVTRQEYQAFLDVAPVPHDELPSMCQSTVDFTPDEDANALACSGDCDEHPAVGVTGCQAAAYCYWAGGYLCFDTQWRAACEGPTTGPQTLYPYGDSYEAGRCNGDGQNAGTLEANMVGICEGSLDTLYNMSGNAAELTRVAPDGAFEVRGGHYQSPATELTCTSVAPEPPGGAAQVGFRCCYDR